MSLLAAFVAMLGKQWLNRYLRHTGGSMVERCGDRQRKFDGLEKWPFHLFVESLSIMLQIALLLLTCGLSRHMWAINASVARHGIVITLTVIGIVFYVGIVVAGTSSYDYHFQTPASTALRALIDHRTAQKLFERLLLATLRTLQDGALPQNTLSSLPTPGVISLICVTQRALASVHRWAHDAVRNQSPLDTSLPSIVSGVCGTGRKIGRLVIIPFLYANRMLRNAKQRLLQEIRVYNRPPLPTTSTDDVTHQSHTGQRDGLLVSPRNFGSLWK